MDDYQRATTTHKTPHPRIGFVYLIPLGIVIGFIIFTISFFVTNGSGSFASVSSLVNQTTITPTDAVQFTPEPTREPTPTEAPIAVAKEELKIRVLNGSGTSGVAGKVATLLKEAGYTDVSTGNADEYDYEDVTIRYVKEAAGALPDVQKALENSYTVSETEEAALNEVALEIVVGK